MKLMTRGTADLRTYSQEQLVFLRAMDKYKQEHHLITLDCRQVLEVAESLGYRKVAERGPLPTIDPPINANKKKKNGTGEESND